MLAGEYAVLASDGHAISAAVGEVARWRLRGGAVPALQLRAFGQTWSLPAVGAAARGGLPDFALATLARFAAAGAPLAAAAEVDVAGAMGGAKVGLGTSAAAVVAVGRAIAASHGRPFGVQEAARCVLAHRDAQGGRGSGYDVISVAAGGVTRFARATLRAEALRWPAGLSAVACWAGTSADTRAALDAVPLTDALRAAIAAGELALAQACRGGDSAAALAALHGCEQAHVALAAKAPWLRHPGLEAMRRSCDDHGGIFRTSGAGGGDCALAVFADPVASQAYASRWREQGGVVVAELPGDLAPLDHSVLEEEDR